MNKESIDGHWEYSKGIIDILTKEYNPSKEIWMELNGYLYTKAMPHGYKHREEETTNE